MKFIFIPNIRTFNYLVSDGGYYLFRVIFITHTLGLISRVIKMNYDVTPEFNIRDQSSPIGDTMILILELWVIHTPVDEDLCMLNFMTSVETVQKILLLHHWNSECEVLLVISHVMFVSPLCFFLVSLTIFIYKSYFVIFKDPLSLNPPNSLPFLAGCEMPDIYSVLKCYMSYI